MQFPETQYGGSSVQYYCVSTRGDGIWPSRFVETPRVGDYVKAIDSDDVLRVNKVTHLISKTPPFMPMVEIGLGGDNSDVSPVM